MASKPQKPNTWVNVANTFGALGYASVFVQWAWMIIVVGYPFFASDMPILFPEESPRITPEQVPVVSMPSVVTIAVSLLITVVMLVISAIVLAKLPRSVGKSGASITQGTAKAIIPTLTHHKKIPKAKQRRLTFTISTIIKTIAVVVPLCVVICAPEIPELGSYLAMVIALFCASMSALYFGVQLITTIALRLSRETIW